MGLIEDITAWTKKNSAPFTVLLIVSFIASSLMFWFLNLKGLELVALTNSGRSPLWAFLTYPWAYMPFGNGLSLMFFVFLMYWLLQVGGSIERDLGTPRFIALWFSATLLAGVVMFLGATACHVPVSLMEPYLPESAITVVWCVRNRTACIMLFGFVPLNGFWLGWATVISNLLLYGAGAPVVGVLACVHLAVAALFAAERIPILPYGAGDYRPGRKVKVNEKEATTRGSVRYDQTYFDEVKRRETERAEQERLKKLFGDE